MTTRCLATACALALSSIAHAQTPSAGIGTDSIGLVQESRIEAKLRNGKTTVALPIRGLSSAVRARIQVEWLKPDDKPVASTVQSIVIPPQGTLFETELPLPADEPLLARLHYRLIPDAANLTAFTPQSGVIAFTEIAPYAYVLSVVTMPGSRAGEGVDVHVVATHPKSGLPVENVELSIGPTRVRTGTDGSATLRLKPDAKNNSGDLPIQASLGDLREEVDRNSYPDWPETLTLSTDKRLYRPGQTLHLRLLAFGSDGAAMAAEGCSIEVTGRDEETVFARDVTTSNFGIAHADWDIPAHAESGEYQVVADCDSAHSGTIIQIRQYELPSFRVMAEPDHAFYVAQEKAPVTAKVTIRAEYLFGKELTAGHVRITAFDEQTWADKLAHKKKKDRTEDPPLVEGDLDAHGRFAAAITQEAPEWSARKQYEDFHYVASVTDPTTNRTEQMRFDIRLSAQPLNIYVPGINAPSALGEAAYLTVFSPDGQPVKADLEVLSEQRALYAVKTNRFGMAKVVIHPGDKVTAVRARRGQDTAVVPWDLSEQYTSSDKVGRQLLIETDRSLYARGEPMQVMLRALGPSASGHFIVWKGSEVLLSKPLDLKGGTAQLTLPYDPRFAGALALTFVSRSESAERSVVFPQVDPFEISVRSERAGQVATYKPGDVAPLVLTAHDGKGRPVDAAFGVSIVDEAVLQRSRVDQQFSRPRYRQDDDNGPETRYGGLTVKDLPLLDPHKVDADVQLAAEALLDYAGMMVDQMSLSDMVRDAFTQHVPRELTSLFIELNNNFRSTFQFPRDLDDLNRVAPSWPLVSDPWGTIYRPVFEVKGAQRVISWQSAGPDRLFGTNDDFVIAGNTQNWFEPFGQLIRNDFATLEDYPATSQEATELLQSQGISLSNLRDPWGTPLRLRVSDWQATRQIVVESAGPSKRFDTGTNIPVEQYSGTWFRGMARRLEAAVHAAPQFPRTQDEFVKAAAAAGIDFRSLRDPWGKPLSLRFGVNDRYENRVHIYSEAEFQSAPLQKKTLEPITVHLLQIEVRSAGADGLAGTYDDFTLATFEKSVWPTDDEPPAQAQPEASAPRVAGTGTLTGTVTDATGAVIPGATVTLDEKYSTKTGTDGTYRFSAVPPGMYRLHFAAPGFQHFFMNHVPVEARKVTRADVTLQVGTTSSTVEVTESANVVNTTSAALGATVDAKQLMPLAPGLTGSSQAATETPRVRNYFAETLLWEPELVTDAHGTVHLPVKLADNITTWKVAVTASTVDGLTAETGTDIRAFLPFFADLDPPPVLTVGDEVDVPVLVRNYTDARQTVALNIAMPPELTVLRRPAQQQQIDAQATDSSPLALRAFAASDAAPIRVTARGQKHADAVERPVAIHPDGRYFERTSNDSLAHPTLELDIPPNVIAGSLHGELKFYPSVLATVLESVKALLQKPHGCAEQTISSAYPNLLFLRLIAQAGLHEPKLEADARKNLQDGYTQLLGYRENGGGFSYWIGQKPDLALTAYAVEFLKDAAAFISIDDQLIPTAQNWMRSLSMDDPTLGALQLRALIALGPKAESQVLTRLAAMANRAQSSDDPYALATFLIAVLDAKHPEIARPAAEKLLMLAQQEQGLTYWNLRKNTPFYGYGNSGRIETTAVVIDALERWQAQAHSKEVQDAIDRGLLFLIRHRGASSYWYSTQPTVRVLRALVGGIDLKNATQGFDARIQVNGKTVTTVSVPGGARLSGPVLADVSRFLQPGIANHVTIAAPEGHALVETQLAVFWYEPWAGPVPSSELTIEARYSTLSPAPNGLVRCDVVAERPRFQGYGMIIAEVGLPPGSEVDRGVLGELIDFGAVDQYEVEPDRIVFYLWPTAGQMKFSFYFRPRLPMTARSAPTQVFDFYNPDVRAIQPPQMFTVR